MLNKTIHIYTTKSPSFQGFHQHRAAINSYRGLFLFWTGEILRYPNLRYGNPEELRYYAISFGGNKAGIQRLAKYLKRDERTVQRWMDEKQRVPWWVPELLRLHAFEKQYQARQMGIAQRFDSLGVVTHAGQLELRRRTEKKPPALTDLRLDDFEDPPKLRKAI